MKRMRLIFQSSSKNIHFSYCLKTCYEAKISYLIHLLLLFSLTFFVLMNWRPAVSPEKTIINWSRTNRKKKLFLGKRNWEDRRYKLISYREVQRTTTLRKNSKNGCHMTRNLVLTYQRRRSWFAFCRDQWVPILLSLTQTAEQH